MDQLQEEYPTHDQMKEMWDALESGDDQKLLAVLRKRRLEREEQEASSKTPQTDSN